MIVTFNCVLNVDNKWACFHYFSLICKICKTKQRFDSDFKSVTREEISWNKIESENKIKKKYRNNNTNNKYGKHTFTNVMKTSDIHKHSYKHTHIRARTDIHTHTLVEDIIWMVVYIIVKMAKDLFLIANQLRLSTV